MKASFDEISKAEFEKLVQPIIDIYSQIELDLMLEVAKRFENYDTVAGSLEWQMKKLDEMGVLNAAVVKKISEYSGVAESAIEEMLKAASVLNINNEEAEEAYKKGVIGVDPKALFKTPTYRNTLEKSFVSLKDTFRLINTRAVEGSKKAYMDVLNRAYIEVSSGIYSYNTSISRALQHMADQGITCATYKRGTRVVRYSIESCVRRDALTATNKLANEVAFDGVKELGAEYVYVSRHLGARVSEKSKIANHAGWQGKAYKIEGSDDNYKNLCEETGYPDEIEGLSGVNCRHRIFPFFPGITVLPRSDFDEEEGKKLYELSQKQRAKERAIRATKRKLAVAEAANDEETARKLREELIERQDDIASFCEDNGLVRQYERENVYFNSTKAKNAAELNKIEPKSGTNSPESIENGAESGIITLSTYFNSAEDIYKYTKNVKPIEGFEDIAIHGDKIGFNVNDADGNELFRYSVVEFVEVLKQDPNYHGGNIRLLSCSTGAEDSVVAQGIADLLGVDVLAPTGDLILSKDGIVGIIGEDGEYTGEWVLFKAKRK